MKRFYVDTNIWLDFALDRRNHIKPLGKLAFQFLKKCIRNRWQVLYSGLVIQELKKELSQEEIEERCFRIVLEQNRLVKVESHLKQMKEARQLAQRFEAPAPDAMHAILARDNHAALVSRDFHFERLSKIVKAFLPEEI